MPGFPEALNEVLPLPLLVLGEVMSGEVMSEHHHLALRQKVVHQGLRSLPPEQEVPVWFSERTLKPAR